MVECGMEVLKMVGGVWYGGTEDGWWSEVLKMVGGVRYGGTEDGWWSVGWRY